MNYRIYKVTNLINKKQYIGLTTQTIEDRWYRHCREDSGCIALRNSIHRHSKESFKIEEIFNTFKEEDLKYFETYFIKQYDTLSPNGYNLTEGGEHPLFSDESKEKCSIAQNRIWSEPGRKEKQAERMIERMKDKDYKEKCVSRIKECVDNKKESIIGINIEDNSIIKFETINAALSAKYYITGSLVGNDVQNHGFCWFYHDRTLPDSYYIDETIKKTKDYRKNGKFWDNAEHKESRINLMIEGSKHRAKPLIAVSKFDGSMIEYPSVNHVIKLGMSWGGISPVLLKQSKHAHNYVWFYKTPEVDYVKEAELHLGGFDNTNIKPFVAINMTTGEETLFNKLEDVVIKGFNKKAVRRVLTGKGMSYSGCTWKFNNS